MFRHTLAVALLFAVSPFGSAQAPEKQAEPSTLTFERIFASGELNPEPVTLGQWWRNSSAYVTLETTKDPVPGRQLVRYTPADGKKEVLAGPHQLVPPAGTGAFSIDRFSFSADGTRMLILSSSQRIWRRSVKGDYWIYDLTSREMTKLGQDAAPGSLMNAVFSPDGSKIAYVQNANIHVYDVRERTSRQLTRDGSDRILNGMFDWVYEEELELVEGLRWSPDGKRIAYWQLDQAGVPPFYIVDNTAGPYAKIITIPYPKVGEKNPSARVGVVDVATEASGWLDIPGDPREHYLADLEWSPNSERLFVQQLNRLQNTNRIFASNLQENAHETYDTELFHTETDPAWLDVEKNMSWIEAGKRKLWLSERTGWRHLYAISGPKTELRPITAGKFDVIGVEAVDDAKGVVYFYASPENPTQHYLYQVRLDGTGLQRISPADQPGWHSYRISPDGKWAVRTYSTANRPPVTAMISLPDHKVIQPLADNKKLVEKLAKVKMPTCEFYRVEIGNNVSLDGWCLKPTDFDPAKKYPVLVHVYGEPAGQTVVDRWGAKNRLWHAMLAQQGYVVVSLDNRGTPAPRGRDWRKCVYRKLGILPPDDQAAGVRALLRDRSYLDPARVAVWGWSGGGSMSLNAIFRHPDLYQTAMSVAPVPNQRHYDTIYQERYMGLPNDNFEGFRDGSPITHAHRLKGNLLVVHGTGDDNCHYLGTESLINELIAHNKAFTMMAYPNRSHSISEGPNTTRHLFALLTRYLHQHTPAGGR